MTGSVNSVLTPYAYTWPLRPTGLIHFEWGSSGAVAPRQRT